MKTKIHKLIIDDFDENDCRFIAIYSDEPGYRMAYLLNYHFDLKLMKSNSILTVRASMQTEFPVFEYMDETYYREFKLITNQQNIKSKRTINEGLFENFESIIEEKVCYLKDLPKTSFILKIGSDESENYYVKFIEKLKQISQVYTADFIDLAQIKNKNLLKI